ncbi:MAG: hypothetical protein IJK78_10735 [Bacteroidales bacterium]|nr:hypothetical protein [Bacteroidales bacterium]
MDNDNDSKFNHETFFQEFHIESVGQINPAATIVINNLTNPVTDKATKAAKVEMDKQALREAILDYVVKTEKFVKSSWKKYYRRLWSDILDLPEVDAVIYDQGRQQGPSFNRYELMHLIHYIGNEKDGLSVFGKFNATQIAQVFEDGCQNSNRIELGCNPQKATREAIDRLLKKKNYQSK